MADSGHLSFAGVEHAVWSALLLAAMASAAQAAAVTLRAVANAGVSSFFGDKSHNKPDERDWSWCGKETLALRQNQNWSGFENKTILLKFDMAPIKGWMVREAFLHLALAKGDLYGVGACTVLGDWREGTADGQPEPGAPSWNHRANPAAGQKPDDGNLWAWPGSGLYSAAWLHPALRYSHAGPNQITRYTDAQGVRWLKLPIDPALVLAMAIGASYGLVLTDDKGQVAEAYMLEKNPKPYTYDPGFEILVYSRHAQGGALAPKLEVTGEAADRVPPAAPKLAAAADPASIEVVAPGDDGTQGPAHAYRVRYSRAGITEANWAGAAELPRYAIPLPAPAGGRQLLHLMTLKPGDWHVAVRAVDKAGNEGPLADLAVRVPEPTVRRLKDVKRADELKSASRQFEGKLSVNAFDDQQRIDPCKPIAAEGAKGQGVVELRAARNEVVAFQLAIEPLAGPVGDVRLSASDLRGPNGAIIAAAKHIELFREWYLDTGKAGWVADALLPLAPPFADALDIPAKDNVGDGQRNQAVWVDVYVPPTAEPGEYAGSVAIRTPALKEPAVVPLKLVVRPFALPDEINWPVELNTYGGIGRFARVDLAKEPERYLKVERAYYQLAHKHRCTLNLLRYTHGGNITEQGAPPLAGQGTERHISDWAAWDARFGPLLDGSAFTEASGYYGPGMGRPLTHFYLPFHENWPMDLDTYYSDRAEFPDRKAFAEWAKKSRRLDETVAPDYLAGFRRVVAETMRHFAQRGWTRTAFQFFLNNKYYYKCPFFVQPGLGMSGRASGRCYWLLDEPVDFDDFDANRFFLSLAQQGVRDSGAKGLRLHCRTDISNPFMARGLWDGICNLWCCSALPEIASTARVRQRWLPGEQWSNYGAGIAVADPPVKQLQIFLNRYALGTVYVLPYWTCFGAGWRKADDLNIYYTGVSYAGSGKTYDGPLPGIRMKLLRRAQQDIEYLNLLASRRGWGRDGVIRALSPWADTPDTTNGLTFTALTAELAAALREAISATIEAKGE